MDGDFAVLVEINRDITVAKNEGAAARLEPHLASTFAFRRADGTIVNREQFLQAAKPSGPRTIEVESIVLRGRRRAIVTCVVSMPVNGQEKRFDNIRLFVRSDEDEWKLLGWANEAL